MSQTISKQISVFIQTVGTGLLNLVYPPLCAGCERWLPTTSGVVCGPCAATCPRGDPDVIAKHLAAWPMSERKLDGAFALWSYGKAGTVRRIQHQLKYKNRPWLGPELGRLMGGAYADFCRSGEAPEADLIIPVPLSKVRLYERSYNQSAMLGEGVAEALGRRMDINILTRSRATRAQARLGKQERKQNVTGAFSVVHPEDVSGRHVVLIDDVMTTGATAVAAAHPLSIAGAASIFLLTLAIAV